MHTDAELRPSLFLSRLSYHSSILCTLPIIILIILVIYFILFFIISYTVRPMCNLNWRKASRAVFDEDLFKTTTYDDNGKDFDSSSQSMPYPPRHHRQSICPEMHSPKINTTTSPILIRVKLCFTTLGF